MVRPAGLNGTDVEEDEDTFTFPLIMETIVGCLMNVEEDMGAKRQGPDCIVDEFAEDEDDDDAEDADEPPTDAPRI